MAACLVPLQVYVLMMFIPSLGDTIMFLSVAIAGFSVSMLFGSMFLWASQYIKVTGFVSGVCLTGASLGMTVGFPMVGYLLENVGHMWMVYILVITSGSHFTLYVLCQLYTAMFHKVSA